jgi:hypothetical protein
VPVPTDSPTTDPPAAAEESAPAPTPGDRVLVGAFWIWAGLLLLVTLSHLFGWDAVLDALDVKRWFGS